MKNRITIIEDNIPLRNAFKDIINAANQYIVVDAYSNCEDAIKYLKSDAPQIVLMDIELPGMNGVEGTKAIKKIAPNTIIIVVTVYENSQIVFDALCAGATGYLTKNITPEQLVSAIDEALKGGAPMSIKIAKMIVQSFQKAQNSVLSERETEVLKFLASGKSYRSIAGKLFISRNTIKYHIKNIYEKLQVSSREDAIQKANDDRLI